MPQSLRGMGGIPRAQTMPRNKGTALAGPQRPQKRRALAPEGTFTSVWDTTRTPLPLTRLSRATKDECAGLPTVRADPVRSRKYKMNWTKPHALLVLIAMAVPCAFTSGCNNASNPAPAPAAADQSSTPLKFDRLDPAADRIIPAGATLERVATGFTWIEGPVWAQARARPSFFGPAATKAPLPTAVPSREPTA